MRGLGLLTATLAGLALAASAAPAWAQGLASDPPPAPGTPAADRVIVRFEPGVAGPERAAARRATGVRAVEALPLSGLEVVAPARGASVPETVAALERRAEVRYAQPDHPITTVARPDDDRYAELWGLSNTGQVFGSSTGIPGADLEAEAAWDRETSGAGVVTAVIDGGIALDHPELAGELWTNPGEVPGNAVDDEGNGYVDDVHGWDFVEGDADPRDADGHGTHVAGTIAARGGNGAGVSGVAWRGRLMSLRVTDDLGVGKVSDGIKAMAYAAANGARVANASIGGLAESSPAEHDAMAAAPGLLLVTAASNMGRDNDAAEKQAFPCSLDLPNVLCVAATTNRDDLATFSNYGATTVDLGAPGRSVLSLRPAYGAPVFADGFETPLAGRWESDGAWSLTGTQAFSGASSLTDSPAGPYPADTDTAVATVSPFSLTGERGCRAFYRVRADVHPSDRLYVESSADGTTWMAHAALFGTNGAFAARDAPLADRTGESAVRLRFRLESDAAGEGDGVYLDDVAVRCLGGTYTSEAYRFLDGTSMAAPHVSGAAALLWTAAPGATVAQVRAALLDSADRVPSLAGRTVSGGRVNVDRAMSALAAVEVAEPDGVTAVAEAGGSDTYTVALALRPKADVVVTPSPGDQVAVGPASHTFTREDWAEPRTFTVTARDDGADEPDRHDARIAHAVTSTDAAYASLAAPEVTVRVADDDAGPAPPGADSTRPVDPPQRTGPPPLARSLPATLTTRVRVRIKRNRFALTITCPPQADGRCTGRLRGHLQQGKRTKLILTVPFSVGAGTTATKTMRAPRALRARRRTRLALTMTQPGAMTIRRTITLVRSR